MTEKDEVKSVPQRSELVVAVSGGFDPLHVGHIRYLKHARKLGTKLVVILNNDNWIKKKKGYCFMEEIDRAEILSSIKYVDIVVLTNHEINTKDMSVCDTLNKVKPQIFANGGDRVGNNVPEVALCEKLGIKLVFNVGGSKVESSSALVKKHWRI